MHKEPHAVVVVLPAEIRVRFHRIGSHSVYDAFLTRFHSQVIGATFDPCDKAFALPRYQERNLRSFIVANFGASQIHWYSSAAKPTSQAIASPHHFCFGNDDRRADVSHSTLFSAPRGRTATEAAATSSCRRPPARARPTPPSCPTSWPASRGWISRASASTPCPCACWPTSSWTGAATAPTASASRPASAAKTRASRRT